MGDSGVRDGRAFESAATTPKRKPRPPRKKQKNEMPKNNFQSNDVARTSIDNDAGKSVVKPEGNGPKSGGGPKNVAGPKNVTTEKTRNPQQKNFPKKRNNNTPKNTNATKPANSAGSAGASAYPSPGQQQQQQDGAVPVPAGRLQPEAHRRQIEEERRKRWYQYFLSKPNDLITMDRHKIIVLKTTEKSRPNAQFVCKVCNYYCDNIPVVAAHLAKNTHIRQVQDYNDEVTLRELPEMTREQMGVLNSYLIRVVTENSMSFADMETRRTITVLVDELVTTNLKGCSIRLFGSSKHGLGLKTADVNMDLQVPEGALPPAMLKSVAELIAQSPHFVNVKENFDCEFPFVSFTYHKSGEQCSISLNNERAVSLALLLSKYTPLDPRLKQLATLFRLWGQLTQTDNAQEGTWPGYAFYLMTIFYLQQCNKPVLPVLNDLLTEKGQSESANTVKVLSMDVEEIKKKWATNNRETLASLWLGLLRFYTIEFNYTEYIVCIDSAALIPRKTRKIFIVDPFLPTRNVARSVSSNSMFYYIIGCLMTTCRYFSLPQTKLGPLFGDIYMPASHYHADHEAILSSHDRINSQLIHILTKLDSDFSQSSAGVQERLSEVMQLMQMHNYVNIDNIPFSYLERLCVPPRHLYRDMCVSRTDARLLVTSFTPRGLDYQFTAVNCTGGQKVPRICGVCKKDGHLKDECPEERLPPLEPLPELTPDARQVLDTLCVNIFEKWKQNSEDIRKRDEICQELEGVIRDVHPTAKLMLFGSTKNGFGLRGSDMDICLVFTDNETGEGLDSRGFIEVLYNLLKGYGGVKDLLPIPTAKVPIVKFTHKATRLDGDISLYNVLAMENSRLLYTYANIDNRARILGYMIKRFSKVCHIGDASKGSLSSYAYTLMVIYFLQRCDPPVLPVLQELTDKDGPCPQHMIEGCNAYFFKDLSQLDKVWKGKGKNTLSVGELWLSLLIFYTEQFDMINNVVCIRCSRTVSKFEKLWISKGIAIEDPFDLSHNLGSALTRKMSLYIIKAFRKGRNHFGHPVKPNIKQHEIEGYYLNMKDLTDGEPPNDRGCRFCKSIGHKERDCPEKKKRGKGKFMKKRENKVETPVKKAPVKNTSEDEEEEEEEGLSDSDKGSSEGEGEGPPTRKPVFRRARGTPTDVASPGPGSQDSSHNAGPKFRPFNKPSPSKHQSPAPKPQTMVKNKNPSPVVMNRAEPPVMPPQMPNGSSSQVHIPTIVFSNSKLNTEVLSPVRFPFPIGQEPSRPPPGFIPLAQNGQRFPNPVPFPHEAKPVGQNSWNFEGVPFYATTPITNPNLEYLRNVPVYASPAPNLPAPPRPPLNNPRIRFTGILAPKEQLIWGQSPPPASQLPPPHSFRGAPVPVPADCSPSVQPLSLDAAVAKMQLTPTPHTHPSVQQAEVKPMQQDFHVSNNEAKQKYHTMFPA